uniref:Apterous n=1 Tax=Euprymna scolopes TaxID=6613 RepID=Q49QW5_EUPSC|nr:apterous [Euprymna scolopes]
MIGTGPHQPHHQGINGNNNSNGSNSSSNSSNHHHHHHHHHHLSNGTTNVTSNGNSANHHHHNQPSQQNTLHQQQQQHPNSVLTQDDHKPFICAGCGDLITERYYLNVANNAWHFNCLKCYECKSTLDTERSCYERMGNYYCRDDYQRLFSTQRCARCNMGIQSTDLVMRARNHVYHLTCFTCFTCNKALQAGDTFGLREHLVYCQVHYENSYHAEYIALSPDMNAGQMPYYNGVGTLQKGRPRKRRSPNISSDEFAHNIGLGADSLDRAGDMIDRDTYQNAPRQKRMRTSFKHHQLRTLKSYFAVNHNPGAKDLKHLAQKTGLTKRVLQVWFQNARAKFRRNCQKQDQDRVSGGGQTGQNQTGQGSDKSDGQAMGELSNEHSPGLSDISSAPSLSDLQGSCLDSDHSNSLSDFFTGNITSLSS